VGFCECGGGGRLAREFYVLVCDRKKKVRSGVLDPQGGGLQLCDPARKVFRRAGGARKNEAVHYQFRGGQVELEILPRTAKGLEERSSSHCTGIGEPSKNVKGRWLREST